MDDPRSILDFFDVHPHLASLTGVLVLLLTAWVLSWITQRLLLQMALRLARSTSFAWDDAILDRGVVRRVTRIAPTLVVDRGIALIPHVTEGTVDFTQKIARSLVAIFLVTAISGLFDAINDLYQKTDRARSRPIKGYLQLAKILLGAFTFIAVIAMMLDRSPLLLLSGLGAMTAVLMLIFQDTLLSLVASVQLTTNDMLRVGDWIEMPAANANGDVIDIALHTVKVQNWDKSISTIPTSKLIKESFRNWRGMQESGGRRIMRAVQIDQSSVRFLTEDEKKGLCRFVLLKDYLAKKEEELVEWNAKLAEHGAESNVNLRRLTNIGTFRAYVSAYLKHHPRVKQDMLQLVRQNQPTPAGLPLEVYCFTNTVAWAEYEGIQADIFDHLFAIIPEFGLRVFQEPGGADVTSAVRHLVDHTVAPRADDGPS